MTGSDMKHAIQLQAITYEDIKDIGLDMPKVIDILEDMFLKQSRGEVLCPDKVILDLGEKEKGRINSMPAYVGGDVNMCGIKWIAGFPQNPRLYGIPRASAVIILNDADNGLPLAILEGTYISAMRTGAVSGIGAKYLARPGAEVVTVIGCSVQAKTQLLAFLAVMKNVKEIRLYDIRREASEGIQAWLRNLPYDGKTVICENPEEAVVGSDVITTVTTADEPIVKGAWLKEGSLLIHVGSFREQDDAAVLNADKIVVDDWEHVLHRGTQTVAKLYKAGKLERSRITAELCEVVAGIKKVRESEQERIFLTPIGLGTEDIAVAAYVYKEAAKAGLGKPVVLRTSEVTY